MQLPNGVLAAGWIPFAVITLVTLVFAWFYINYFKSKYDNSLITTATSVLALSVTLFTTFLTPVDVFLVSFMKDGNGTFKEWATDPGVRSSIETGVLYSYYALYGVVGTFIFLILPFVYFFYEERDEYTSFGHRVCSALKYTVIFLLLAAILITIGSLIPLKEAPLSSNATEWEKIESLIHELGSNKGEDILSFVLSVLTVIGMTVFIVFGGYGLSNLPCGMIKGTRSLRFDREELDDKRVSLASRIASIKTKYVNDHDMTARDRSRLNELQEEMRLLERQERHLVDASGSWLRKCLTCLRPFEMIGGVALTIVGLLIFLSLLLTNIDKAMNSLGPKMGYILPTRTLPNPIDIVLVYAEKVFPLDYVMFSGIVIFCLLSAISGLRKMGLWFLWIRMYRIRPGRTRPQGLLMMCMSLMFMILAINVIVYSITPQYVMYGSQQYWGNATEEYTSSIGAQLRLLPCSTDAPLGNCTMSRTSMLLTRFCFKAWIFGAIYYWSTWTFLVVVVIGSFVSVFQRRRSSIEESVDRDDFDESDEELLRI